MTEQGNVHDNNVTEAQVAVLKAVTPLILAMSKDARGTLIIGNPNLQENLRVGLALMPKIPAGEPVVQKPTLIFRKKTMLGSTSVTVYGLGKRLTIAHMLRALLKSATDASLDEVERLLKERKHPILAAQADEMLESQAKFFRKEEDGEDFDLRGDGWSNLILVQNLEGSISVVGAYWDDGRWYRGRDSLVDDRVWYTGGHLVVSNSDASNL